MSMPIESPAHFRRNLRHELEALRGEWFWFVILGAALVVLGTVALGASMTTSLITILFVGVVLLIGGVMQVVGAFWAREWSGFFLSLLEGIFYLVMGLLFIREPVDALLTVTLVLAAFLMVGGLFKIIAAVSMRMPHWGWPLLSGVLNVLLGILIWIRWPASALWVIGLFVGIEMIFNGWAWVMLGLALRKLPSRASRTTVAA